MKGSKLRAIDRSPAGLPGFRFYCPGCDENHWFDSRWTFDGNMEEPTVAPSLLFLANKRCHLFVTKGTIVYLKDCEHYLAGKTVDMAVLGD